MPDVELLGAIYPDVPAVDLPKSGGGLVRFYDPSEINYAGSATSGGSATVSEGIPYGAVDSTSTATAFTATVPGITELKDGTVVLLRNGVITSAANFTININGLGAKPAYSNMATGNAATPTAPTRETTIFNLNYTMMFIYCEDLVSGGAWICYRGYDANTNTIPSASSATPQALGTASAGSSTDYSRADHVHAKPTATQIGAVPGSGTTCNSGGMSHCEHNANNMWQNGFYYIGSNQNNPPVTLGVQNADASCFVQSYNDQWVTQIAQDYRDGQMFVRSKKQGVWQPWKAVPMFTTSNGAKGSATQPLYVDAAGMLQSTTYTLGASVPAVTSADNGKVMRVVDGAWAAVSLPSASGVSF